LRIIATSDWRRAIVRAEGSLPKEDQKRGNANILFELTFNVALRVGMGRRDNGE